MAKPLKCTTFGWTPSRIWPECSPKWFAWGLAVPAVRAAMAGRGGGKTEFVTDAFIALDN